ncbi:glycosyltransferase family 2 protein [Pseudooceanicola sp. C21-150M6]|uniref:glycosyltransferase family 2 protein n=1 Tax=Pseudooceanicola sp. C21-150M6 TaxID=3434355 RepID=UPI003D7FC59A
MVRDDEFFLRIWLDYYGGLLGLENCYVINHGRGRSVAEMAAGANVIGIPGDPHKNFDAKRWKLLNGVVAGLRSYYKHVIVGDVDELVVLDPEAGKSLLQFLEDRRGNRVFTPLGLEVIHRIDIEHAPIRDRVLGPRRHVRLAPHYSKPCVTSVPAKIARGGHFTEFPELITPDNLYLFHLKFCDFPAYAEAMDRRNAVTAAVEADRISDVSIGRHWFADARGDDRALFESFADLPLQEGFEMKPFRKAMHNSWGKRGDTGYYEFDREDQPVQFQLPERFDGMF